MHNVATAFLAISSVSAFTPITQIQSSRSANFRSAPHLDRLRLPTSQPLNRYANAALFNLADSPSALPFLSNRCSWLDVAGKATHQQKNQPIFYRSIDEFAQTFCNIPGAEKSQKRQGPFEGIKRITMNRLLKRVVYKVLAATELTEKDIISLRNRECREALSHIPEGISVSSVTTGEIQAEWLMPIDTKHLLPKVGLYFPGGAYLTGSAHARRSITGNLAGKANMKILTCNYRKSPEHAYPAALQDAECAYDYLISLGYRAADIVIMGDSSGGHLALSLALLLKEKYPIKEKHPHHSSVAGLILLSPWTDMTMTSGTIKDKHKSDPILPAHRMREVVDLFAGDMERSDPRISPLYADLHGLPPMLIHVGENEILLGDSTSLAKKAHAADVPTKIKIWTDMPHVFHVLHEFLPEGKLALKEVANFVKNL